MIRQTPDLMSFALRMYYAMTYVTDESVASSGGEISSTGEYVQQTVIRTFKSYGDMFDLQETLGNFTGLLENVTDTMYVLEELSMKQKHNMESTKLERAAMTTLLHLKELTSLHLAGFAVQATRT